MALPRGEAIQSVYLMQKPKQEKDRKGKRRERVIRSSCHASSLIGSKAPAGWRQGGGSECMARKDGGRLRTVLVLLHSTTVLYCTAWKGPPEGGVDIF